MRKAFISILGTNDYLECRHKFGDIVTDTPVKYCQEDIIKLFCKDFNEESEIRIFLTEEAEKKNWFNNGHQDKNGNVIQNEGLKSKLEKLNLPSSIKTFKIKEGFNENELWQNFQIIFESFREDEEVIVDITHSFRSLPMLMITLLNFAKQVKKIKVTGIYYAAFESLGTISDVRNIPVQERVAPILDLTSFSELQDWTNATFDFINNANVRPLKNLGKTFQKRSSKNLGDKETLSSLNELNNIIENIILCRGNYIYTYDFESLKNRLLNIKNIDSSIKPLSVLVDKLISKIEKFEKPGIKNLLYSIRWCFEHKFYQQAITLLQETIITIVLNKFNYNENDRNNRELVSNCFFIKKNSIEEQNWREVNKKNNKMTKQILEMKLVDSIYDDYEYLTKIRNDINHGGFEANSMNLDSIKSRLRNSINNIFENINEFLED